MSKADQAIALLDAINGLRAIRDELESLELPGAVDEVDRLKAYLGRQLRDISNGYNEFIRLTEPVAARFAR